jgi:hypothetical protein
MNLTTTNITFLKDVHSSIKVEMTSGWRHHYFEGLSEYEIWSFIKRFRDDKIFLLIPLFDASKTNATLNLSEPFLVNNQSNPVLITKFIMDQWNSSGFNINQGTLIQFSFKFKRVWFTYK